MELTGARCLVVGGARRLGRQIALGLAAGGGAICVASRGGDEALEATLGELERAGAAAALPVRGDVGTPRGAAALVKTAAAALGGLDVLVFAASGPFVPQRPEALDEAAWDASFDMIAKGFFFAACAARDVFAGDRSRDGDRGSRPRSDARRHPRRRRRDHGLPRAAPVGRLRGARRREGGPDPPRQGARPRLGGRRRARVRRRPRPRRPRRRRAPRGDPARRGEDRERTAGHARAGRRRRCRLCIENDGMTGVNVVVDAGSLLAS